MRELVLFRHARAEQSSPSGDDHDRGVTADGMVEAVKVAREIAAAGVSPQIALVSTATRCLGTWECVAQAFPETELRSCSELYLAGAGDILQLAEKANYSTVMVIGHNPGLKQLTARLSGRGCTMRSFEQSFRFPPAAAALFRSKDDTDKLMPCQLFLP